MSSSLFTSAGAEGWCPGGPGRALPRFDFLLLGLGPDGHTASLFPGTDALEETTRLAVATRPPGLGTDRITLTLPVLNHAACVAFLVIGAEKAHVVRAVLDDASGPPLPAQRVRPAGRLLWLLDAAAGPGVKSQPRGLGG